MFNPQRFLCIAAIFALASASMAQMSRIEVTEMARLATDDNVARVADGEIESPKTVAKARGAISALRRATSDRNSEVRFIALRALALSSASPPTVAAGSISRLLYGPNAKWQSTGCWVALRRWEYLPFRSVFIEKYDPVPTTLRLLRRKKILDRLYFLAKQKRGSKINPPALVLGYLGDHRALPILEQMPIDKTDYAIARIGTADALQFLFDLIDVKSPKLAPILRSKDQSMGTTLVIDALAKAKDLRVEPILLRIFNDPGSSRNDRQSTADSLAWLGTPAAQAALLRVASDMTEDPGIRCSLSMRLGIVGGPGVFEFLSEYINEPGTSVYCPSYGIALIADRRGVPVLEEVLKRNLTRDERYAVSSSLRFLEHILSEREESGSRETHST